MSASIVQTELVQKSLHQVSPLTATNFTTWKYRLQLILRDRRLWKYVDGSAPAPAEGKQLAEWEDKDQQAHAQIALTVSDSALGHIRNARSAREAWTKICSVFEQKGLAAKVFLRRKLVNLKLEEGQSMLDHINTVRELSDQLNAIGAPVVDGDLAITLLCSLPERYDPLIIALESRDPEEVTFDVVAARLLSEEQRQKESEDKQYDAVTKAENAFHVKAVNGKSQLQCSHCGRQGHTEDRCWSKQARSANAKKHGGESAGSTYAGVAFAF
jgi:hypothetical protein